MDKTREKQEATKPAQASMHFSEKGKVQPKGMNMMSLEDDCTITIKGKVKDLSGPGEYDKGTSIRVEMSSCEMVMDRDMMKQEKTTLSEALTAAEKSRKKV